jgi:hypothetical protein
MKTSTTPAVETPTSSARMPATTAALGKNLG